MLPQKKGTVIGCRFINRGSRPNYEMKLYRF